VLDRLLGLSDPDLTAHFKEEGITTTLFASAWFITIFTNTLKQNCQDGIVNESLLQVWDQFLFGGWQAAIKISAYIIISHKHLLLKLPFEDILPLMPDCAKAVLQQERSDLLYGLIKKEFKGLKFSFFISKLSAEFEESHKEVKLQPLKKAGQKK
jgi:hypothetical protein